jgi:hypothetical protein
MLTILHPEIMRDLKDFYAGIWPRHMSDGSMVLIIKCTKEGILAAKMTGGIRLYVVPAPIGAYRSAGVITAFLDDDDEPLTVTSPLFEDDSFTTDVLALLSRELFDLHFFDENNHELLGYRARNPAFERFKALTAQFSFAPFSFECARTLHSHMGEWFGLRTAADDDDAFPIEFVGPLFPDDLFIADHTEAAKGFHGNKGAIHTTLERKNAGPMHEMDIVILLQRVFPSEQIYLNPKRTDYPDLEFVDLMVVTEKYLYLLQAKDSPNIEAMLHRKIERKRKLAVAHLTKAVRQLGGAIKYARSKEPMTVTTGVITHTIAVHSRTIVGLVVLKEMFDVDAAAYAGPTLELAEDAQVPCVAMDYAQLHACTLNLLNETAFLKGFQAVLNAAFKNGMFPRLRFGLIEEM